MLQGLILDELSISNYSAIYQQIKKFKTNKLLQQSCPELGHRFYKSREKYLDFVVVGCTNVNELNEIYNNFKLKSVNFMNTKLKRNNLLKWKTFQQ